jgi:hypothetical protein
MPTIINYVKKNTKNIIIIITALLMLPLVGFLTETIYHLGTICGTYIRMLIENGVCF